MYCPYNYVHTYTLYHNAIVMIISVSYITYLVMYTFGTTLICIIIICFCTDFGLLIGSDILNFRQHLGAAPPHPRVLDRLVPQLEPPFGNPVYGPADVFLSQS